jgi:hypothetical protein
MVAVGIENPFFSSIPYFSELFVIKQERPYIASGSLLTASDSSCLVSKGHPAGAKIVDA